MQRYHRTVANWARFYLKETTEVAHVMERRRGRYQTVIDPRNDAYQFVKTSFYQLFSTTENPRIADACDVRLVAVDGEEVLAHS